MTLRIGLFALFGVVFGSFVTVLVHRTPLHQSVVSGRSRCPTCGEQIGARDNIPVLSWLLLRGRCRRCGARISVEYPLTEAATGALFAGAAAAFGDVAVAAVMALFLAVMLAVTLTDLHHRLIPNAIVYPGLAVGAVAVVALAAAGRDVDLPAAAIGFVAYGGALLGLALLRPGGMGMGDAKLGALIGLVLGSQGLRYVAVAAGLGVLFGGLGGIVALLAGRSRKSTLPFGPYLAAGAAAAAFWAAPISRAYLSALS